MSPGKQFLERAELHEVDEGAGTDPHRERGGGDVGGMPWLSMIGSAMTPIAIAAPTPYIEVNSKAVTSVMIIAVTSGRSPASSTAERITLSAMPVWIRTCANQAPNTMMMTALA